MENDDIIIKLVLSQVAFFSKLLKYLNYQYNYEEILLM